MSSCPCRDSGSDSIGGGTAESPWVVSKEGEERGGEEGWLVPIAAGLWASVGMS